MLELLQAITGIFVVVYDGQHALKFTLGRARYVVGPGVHFKWPIIERFAVHDTRHTTLDLEPQVIQLQDDLVYEVDVKVMYQIIDLMKAVIEIDDLVTGLQNRIVMAVQRVIQAQTRLTIYDTEALTNQIRARLADVEAEWGVRMLAIGFSNISPSPATLEITQLDLLARERHNLYRKFVEESMAPEAAVALVTGAVISTQPMPWGPTISSKKRAEEKLTERLESWAGELEDTQGVPESDDEAALGGTDPNAEGDERTS